MQSESFTDAASLLQALRDSTRWSQSGDWFSPWVFRGQRDSTWALTPAAWRAPHTPALSRLSSIVKGIQKEYGSIVIQRLHPSSKYGRVPDENVIRAHAHALAEFRLILEFVEMADRLGHPVPGMARYIKLREYDWLPEAGNQHFLRFALEPNPATTLAQHHGIPTRYLDWTRSSVKAAFFAAADIDPKATDGELAIWAIRPDLLNSKGNAAATGESERFLSYEVNRSENEYLRAQDGLFIYPLAACHYMCVHGRWPSLEAFALRTQEVAKEPVMKKLTLPKSEAGELLRLLWLENVSKAHLMPTYDNITEALISKWRWYS